MASSSEFQSPCWGTGQVRALSNSAAHCAPNSTTASTACLAAAMAGTPLVDGAGAKGRSPSTSTIAISSAKIGRAEVCVCGRGSTISSLDKSEVRAQTESVLCTTSQARGHQLTFQGSRKVGNFLPLLAHHLQQ